MSVVRKAQHRDVYEIVRLWVLSGEEEPAALLEPLGEENVNAFFVDTVHRMGDPETRILVSEHDGRIVGFSISSIHRMEYSNRYRMLHEILYVHPDYRNTFGSRELVRQTSKRFGDVPVYSEEIIAGMNADALWKRRGFRPVRVLYQRINDGDKND